MNSKRKKARKIGIHVFLIVFILIFNLPTISMIMNSIKSKKDAMKSRTLFPKELSLESYRFVLTENDFMRNVMNSLFIAVVVCICCIIIACLAGYALSRTRGRFFSFYGVFMLVLQMFPIMLMLIPLYIIYKELGIINTYWSVIISYTCINLPFSIWMVRAFFDSIPVDLEEAAMIDGCNRFQSMRKIVWPLSAPGICSVGIFTFLNAWNEYTLASIFLRSEEVQPLTVGLQKFVMQNVKDWSSMSAAATIGTIPTLLFLLFAQKYLVAGLTAGSMKG